MTTFLDQPKPPRLRQQWLGESNVRPLIVKVKELPDPWRWHCPGHGGLGYVSWSKAQTGLEQHLTGSWVHRSAVAL